MWMQDLAMDYNEIDRLIKNLPFRGVKGTTGTQASFLELFDGDHNKVKLLNKEVCEKLGFSKWVSVSGQTYTRKIDFQVLSALSGLAQVIVTLIGSILLYLCYMMLVVCL